MNKQALDNTRLSEIVTADYPPVNKQLLLIWKAESITPLLNKVIDEWIEVIEKKKPMIEMGTYEEAIKFLGKPATMATGGTVGDVKHYFENADTSHLPPSAALYIREQILNDPALAGLDENNETFQLIKNAIDSINKKHVTVKTEDFIDVPEEQMQQRAKREVELPVEKPLETLPVVTPVNLDKEPEPEIDERTIIEQQITDYRAAIKYLSGADKEEMETAISDLQTALKYLPEKKEHGGKIGLTKDDLSEYGQVEICEEKDGKFHVKITKGFDTNFNKTFELMGKINDAVGHKYSIVDKCVTDDNLFDYVLSPKKKSTGGFFSIGNSDRPKSALMRDRKYTSEQEWEVDYHRKGRKRHYKEDGGELESEEKKGLDLPEIDRYYLMVDYLKKTYPEYTDAALANDPEYGDGEEGDNNYNDIFFEMVDDLRESYLREEEDYWANTIVENYMGNQTDTYSTEIENDFFPSGKAKVFYKDREFVGLIYKMDNEPESFLPDAPKSEYTVWFFDLPKKKTLEKFLKEAKSGKHTDEGSSVLANGFSEAWDEMQSVLHPDKKKSGGKLHRNLSRDRQFVSHQEWEMNYARKLNAKHYKADGGAFNTDLLFQGGTMADLKRKLALGTAVKLVNWQGKTDPSANPNIGVTRYVVKAQSNSVAFNADKNAKTGSWWEFPPASLVEITPTGFKVYEPARRPLNAEEQAVMDKQPVDAEQQQIDVMTDGNVMYYRRKDYFENAGYGYLYNHNWEKGKLYSNGVVLDKSIKGNLALEYEFVDERSGGGRAKQHRYAEGYKTIDGVRIVADSEFDDNPLFFVWSEYPKYKKLDHRGYLRYSYEFYSDKSGNKYLVISDPKEATEEELRELLAKVNWDMARNVDSFVEGSDKHDYARWLDSISKNGGELSSKENLGGTTGYEATIYYKDEPDDLKVGYLFSEGDSTEDDDSIFFYVEDEKEMKSLMQKDNGEDFVVVSYEPTKLFKKGGRLKSALMRDRKYTSQQEWEKDYHRQGRRKFYKADGGELSAEAIPVLSTDATWEDVKKYLLWLKDSEFAYHIDDNPEEVVTFSEDVAKLLKKNSDIVWKHASDEEGTNLWEVYYPVEDEVEPGYMVMNVTDGIHASAEVYKTRAEAQAFINNFPKRFKFQGYYTTANQQRIKPEDIVLEIVPVGEHIWHIPRDKFVNDAVLYTDAFKAYPSSITDNVNIVAIYESPLGGTNEFKITKPTATKAKHYAKLVHEWVVQQALNDGELIPAEVMKDYPKMIKQKSAPVDSNKPAVPVPFEKYISDNGDEVKGYVSNWSTGGTKYKGLPVVYGVTEHAPGSFMIVSGILKDNILLSTTEAYDDWFGNEDDALSVAHEIATNVDAVFKKGGRLKSAINRDRKYTSKQEWEKNYGRVGRRKFYKEAGGDFNNDLLATGGKIKDDPNSPYTFVIKKGDKAYISDKKDPLYLSEGKVLYITGAGDDAHAQFIITNSTNLNWKNGEQEHIRLKHLTKMRDLIGIEFPESKFKVPYFVTVENGFEDTSWHNDETASFSNIKEGIKLWVYPADKNDRDDDIKQYIFQPCDSEGTSLGVDLLLTDDEREAGHFFEEYKSVPKFKVKYEVNDTDSKTGAIDKGSLIVRAETAGAAEEKAISIIGEQNGSNAIVTVKSVMKTLETGGAFSKFLNKASDIAHKGVAGAKKGYDRADKYAREKVHEKKKDIAIEVLDKTRDKIAGDIKIPESNAVKAMSHITKAIEMVESNFGAGGKLKGKKIVLLKDNHDLSGESKEVYPAGTVLTIESDEEKSFIAKTPDGKTINVYKSDVGPAPKQKKAKSSVRAQSKHIEPATNFDIRISKKLANALLDSDTELLKDSNCEIYCKELGKNGVWEQYRKEDLVKNKIPSKYKTFEIWITGKLTEKECTDKLNIFIIANNIK